MPRYITCTNCGQTVPFNLYYSETPIARRMRVKSLCFDCAFWTDYMEHPQVDTTIVSGTLYVFVPIDTPLFNKQRRRQKGIVFARNMETGEPVYALGCQRIANVPDNFKDLLPDQYRFISEETYAIMISRMGRDCLAKGCWDRYQCLWYNRQKAEPVKPWNTVPPYHNPGDENCESFINTDLMYNVNIEE